MRQVFALLALAACARLAVAADEEVERPYEGRLPHAVSDGYGATRIVDATTGKAIPGARLRMYAEDISPLVVRYAELLGEGVADEDGFAWVAFGSYEGDRHWAASAPGFAAYSEIGFRPPETMSLMPGRDVSGRILDALGRPLPDVAIEARTPRGCPHVPSLARATTDADGRFSLRDADPHWSLWLAPSHGGAAEDSSVPDFYGLGDAFREHVLEVGWTAVGRVLDPEGEPIAGVVVRPASGYPRGPVAVTGVDGTFRLPGVRMHQPLWLVHPRFHDAVESPTTELSKRFVLHAWADGTPVLVRLGADGILPDPVLHPLRVRVRAPTADSSEVSLRITRKDDGRSWLLRTTAEESDPKQSKAEMRLPAGAYHVSSGWPFDAAAVRAASIEVRSGGGAEIVLEAEARPRLRIDGPVDARGLTLVVPGAATSPPATEGGVRAPLWLPPDAPAVVQVEGLGRRHFVAVGPPTAGVRAAALPPVRPHRIRFQPPDDVDCLLESTLRTWVHHDAVPGGIDTYAAGGATVTASWNDRDYVFPLTLPGDRAVDVQLDLATASPAGLPEASLVLDAPGAEKPAKPSVDAKALDDCGCHSGRLRLAGLVADDARHHYPCAVRITAPGWQTLHVVVSAGGEHRATWGTAALALEVVGPEGMPEPFDVAIDGSLHRSDGRLTVRGLTAGAHRLLVASQRGGRTAKELRLVLKDGETRERRVVLDAR